MILEQEQPKIRKFSCQKGHEWDSYIHTEFYVDDLTSGPLCPYCLIEFMRANFGGTEEK